MAYTTINDPSAQFQTALYTGNGGANTITNDGNSNLQADMIWFKERSSTSSHHLFDTNRGVGGSGKALYPNNGDAESADTALTSLNTDGFTLANTGGFNENGQTNVGWQWKCNGGTTSTNSSGTITSTTQVNTTAGFSIVTYTGNGVNGATFGHGLSSAPTFIMVKCLSDSYNWMVYNSSLAQTKAAFLDLTNGADADAVYWSNTAPTSGLVSLGTNGKGNANTENYVAYCFNSIPGYSISGTFQGNEGTDGPFIFTGFKPAWIMVKRTNTTGTWLMWDSQRDPTNVSSKVLKANINEAENTGYWKIDIVSNGFKIRAVDGEINGDGAQLLYQAFAANPFVTSDGVPTTAR